MYPASTDTFSVISGSLSLITQRYHVACATLLLPLLIASAQETSAGTSLPDATDSLSTTDVRATDYLASTTLEGSNLTNTDISSWGYESNLNSTRSPRLQGAVSQSPTPTVEDRPNDSVITSVSSAENTWGTSTVDLLSGQTVESTTPGSTSSTEEGTDFPLIPTTLTGVKTSIPAEMSSHTQEVLTESTPGTILSTHSVPVTSKSTADTNSPVTSPSTQTETDTSELVSTTLKGEQTTAHASTQSMGKESTTWTVFTLTDDGKTDMPTGTTSKGEVSETTSVSVPSQPPATINGTVVAVIVTSSFLCAILLTVIVVSCLNSRKRKRYDPLDDVAIRFENPLYQTYNLDAASVELELEDEDSSPSERDSQITIEFPRQMR